jgi:hypothetical protein
VSPDRLETYGAVQADAGVVRQGHAGNRGAEAALGQSREERLVQRAPPVRCRPYEVQLTCDTDAPLVPYQLEQVADSYRYDRDVAALGHGCAVDAATGPDGSRPATLFAAEHATSRVYPRTSHTRPDGSTVPIDALSTRALTGAAGAAGQLFLSAHCAVRCAVVIKQC